MNLGLCLILSSVLFTLIRATEIEDQPVETSSSSSPPSETYSRVIRRRVSKSKDGDENVPKENHSFKKVLRRKPSDDEDQIQQIKPNSHKSRDGRLFSLFTVVRFKNDPCMTTATGNGTCYTNFECKHRGGNSQGACASGFGVCCFFLYNCGRSTGANGTYFTNPAAPQRICNLQVERISKDICQIRLELELFDIHGPNFQGVCDTDFFLATGGSPVPPICGINTGQHLVYTIEPNSGPTQMSVITDTTVTSQSTRSFRIRVLQLECTHPFLAPNGCLQYYIGASGNIRSFNYKTTVTTNLPNHLANLNYAICFRIENGYCGMKYSQPANDLYSFTVSGDASMITAMTMLPLPTTGVMYGDTACQKDYIVITGGSQNGIGPISMFFSKDRYCGVTLGFCGVTSTQSTSCAPLTGPVVTYYRPFYVGVMTDPDEGPMGSPTDIGNRGFNLIYSQQPCISG